MHESTTQPTEPGYYWFDGTWLQEEGGDYGPCHHCERTIALFGENGWETFEADGYNYDFVGTWIGPIPNPFETDED